MAGSFCVYLERALLDHVLGKQIWTPPDNWFVALSLDPFDPTITSGTALNEPTVSDYARLEVANALAQFPAATGANPASKSNAADLAWGAAAAEDWGTIQAVYLVDAITGGNPCLGADFTSGYDVASGQIATIPAGTWAFNGT